MFTSCNKEEIHYSSGLEYTLSDDGSYYILSGIGTCSDRDIAIPYSYNKLPICSIAERAFENCKSITSITLTNNIKHIGDNAFLGCTNLVFNEHNNAYYLGTMYNSYYLLVSAKDKNITSCNINYNTNIILPDAFYGCNELSKVTISVPISTCLS